MNKVELTGRCVADPTIRYTQGATPMCVANFNLAVQRSRKAAEGEQSADFPRLVAYGKQAEFIEKYVKKGTKLEVIGRITTGSYTDKNGQKVYTTEVTVEQVEFGESKSASEGRSDAPAAAPAASAPAEPAAPAAEPEVLGGDFMDFSDEELPFN